MRNASVLGALALFLVACGGGGSGSDSAPVSGGGSGSDGQLPPAVPSALISGSAVDGLIQQGIVKAYSFTGGIRGAQLGSAVTDNAGHYSLSIQVETQPILLEVTGGHYKEEADAKDITLGRSQSMTAVYNFVTATPVTIAITPWTHIAAALAHYKIARGDNVTSAITTANASISSVVGIDITTVIPLDVTSPTNLAGAMTDALRYGWMSAAISQWTYDVVSDENLRHVEPNTSIALAQTMYDDVHHDGLLNGVGTTGTVKFADIALSTDIYRNGFAAAMLKFTGNQNNATGLTPTKVILSAETFRQGTGSVWGSFAIKPFGPSTITIISPDAVSFLRGPQSVISALFTDPTGIYSSTLLVDDKEIATNADATNNVLSTTFKYDSTALADGSHKVSVKAVNGAGLSTVQSITAVSDNTAPVLHYADDLFSPYGLNAWPLINSKYGCAMSGIVDDPTSGMSEVIVEFLSQSVNRGVVGKGTIEKGHDWKAPNTPTVFSNYGYLITNGIYAGSYAWNVLVPVSNFQASAASVGMYEYDVRLSLTDKAGNSIILNTTQGIHMSSPPYRYECNYISGNDVVRYR